MATLEMIALILLITVIMGCVRMVVAAMMDTARVHLDTLDKTVKFMIHAIRYNVITRDIALVKTAFAWMDALGTTVGTRVTILFY